MDKNKKIKYIISWLLCISIFIVSEVKINKTNYNESNKKESPMYTNCDLSVDDLIPNSDNKKTTFPMMLRDFITKSDGKAQITIRKLNPLDSLMFKCAILNKGDIKLLVTNKNNETIDVYNADISAIYIKENENIKFDKIIKNINNFDEKDLKKYDVINFTNSKDTNFKLILNDLDNKELIITPIDR